LQSELISYSTKLTVYSHGDNSIDSPGRHSAVDGISAQYPKRHRKAQKNRRPAILTINGQAEIIVQDIKSYQQLLARVEEANKLLELRRSIAEYRAGRARPMDEALDDLEAANPSKTGRAR